MEKIYTIGTYDGDTCVGFMMNLLEDGSYIGFDADVILQEYRESLRDGVEDIHICKFTDNFSNIEIVL